MMNRFLIFFFLLFPVVSWRNFNPTRHTSLPLFNVLEEVLPTNKYAFEIPPGSSVYIRRTGSWINLSNDENKSGMETKIASIAEVASVSKYIPEIQTWRTMYDSQIATQTVATPPITTPPRSLAEYMEGSYRLEAEHEFRILDLWKLVKKNGSTKHLNEQESAKVIEALKICYIALWGRKTKRSLEDSSNLARGTASVLGELNATVEVVLAGILHEVTTVLESSNEYILLEALKSRFGNDVITLAEKYARLPVFMARTAEHTPLQSQAQLEMLVSRHEDYDCLNIRLAERIHTMRELKRLPIEDIERRKIAEEALNVYAPLAHKMGLMRFRNELEDEAFCVLLPEMYSHCKRAQVAANVAYYSVTDTVKQLLQHDQYLKEHNIKYSLKHRIKGKYQIFRKMQRKQFDDVKEVRDALGIRIVLDVPRHKDEDDEAYEKRSHTACYYVLDMIRNLTDWDPDVDRGFKDYIQLSKYNGYQSLHQYLRSKKFDSFVEFQIRSKEMHIRAEFGEAAHWNYKDCMHRPEIANSNLYRLAWRSAEQMAAERPRDVISKAKSQLQAQRTFVFLEDRSRVINIKRGSTALDAAFYVHTDVGLHANKIHVNGRLVSHSHVLRDGDVLSVTKAETSIPLKDKVSWLGFANSNQAQQTIRKHLRELCPNALLVMGIVQFLSLLMNNEDVIATRCIQRSETLSAANLKKLCESKHYPLEDFFRLLATNDVHDITQLAGKILDIKQPTKRLKALSFTNSLMWARSQSRSDGYGWEDEAMKTQLLKPLLKDIYPNLEKTWNQVVGSGSLNAKKPFSYSAVILVNRSFLPPEDKLAYTKSKSNDPHIRDCKTVSLEDLGLSQDWKPMRVPQRTLQTM
jgi:(p)ppGpp synthase/HD superfamily hydrolase